MVISFLDRIVTFHFKGREWLALGLRSTVGASLLAKLTVIFASKLAPTRSLIFSGRGGFNAMIVPLLTLISLMAVTPAFAAFQASVDRNPVAEGESLTLTLKSDENLDGDPDLSELQQDFDVLGKSSGSNMQIINGRVSRSVQWQI